MCSPHTVGPLLLLQPTGGQHWPLDWLWGPPETAACAGGWIYCSAGCKAQPRHRGGHGSQRVVPTATNSSEGEFENGALQHRCEQGSLRSQKWLLPVALSLRNIPTGSCLSSRCFKISISGSPSPTVHVLFKLVFLHWFWGQVSLGVGPVRGSFSSTAVQ